MAALTKKDLRYIPKEEVIKEIGELVIKKTKCEGCGEELAVCVKVERIEDAEDDWMYDGEGGKVYFSDTLVFDYQCMWCRKKFYGESVIISK
jgi:hypothetical protein